MLVLNVILLVLFILLLGTTFYFLVFSIASVFPLRKRINNSNTNHKIAVLIPGYKEDAVILGVAKDALTQSYDQIYYDVIVIADSFSEETLAALRKLPIKVIEVSFDKSTKSKALNRAMAVLDSDYDIALILDADNVMDEHCLERINQTFGNATVAVQCHRTAKNLNTPFAILDGISEEINNNIFRKGHRVMGFSSGLIGSGMAFRYDYFKSLMSKIEAVGGFDKELELRILERKDVIEYLDDVYVYDEKVQRSEVFYNQRRRWISSQGRNFLTYLGPAFKQLLRGNLNYFDKVYQWIHPPRVIYIVALVLISSAIIIFHPSSQMVMAWTLLLLGGILSFLLAIPRRYYNFVTLKALFSLPKAFWLMLKALLQVKGSNKEFIHTEHTAVEVEKVNRSSPTRKAG